MNNLEFVYCEFCRETNCDNQGLDEDILCKGCVDNQKTILRLNEMLSHSTAQALSNKLREIKKTNVDLEYLLELLHELIRKKDENDQDWAIDANLRIQKVKDAYRF